MSRYKDDAERIKQDAKFEPIKVLVWGPGNPGPDAPEEKQKAYEKRVEIKRMLQKEFSRAEVFFSEDPEMDEISDGVEGQLEKEALQAAVADVIVMLDLGRGVDLELDHFIPTYAWFREKVRVLIPENYISTRGLVKEIYDYLRPNQLRGFTQDEFSDCEVSRVKAVKIVHGVALAHFLKRLENK